jgi:hypothetical protein
MSSTTWAWVFVTKTHLQEIIPSPPSKSRPSRMHIISPPTFILISTAKISPATKLPCSRLLVRAATTILTVQRKFLISATLAFLMVPPASFNRKYCLLGHDSFTPSSAFLLQQCFPNRSYATAEECMDTGTVTWATFYQSLTYSKSLCFKTGAYRPSTQLDALYPFSISESSTYELFVRLLMILCCFRYWQWRVPWAIFWAGQA